MSKRNTLENKKLRRESNFKDEFVNTPEVKYTQNDVCKNASFVKDEVKKTLINVGCKNLRVDGSSHCTDCSYKHLMEKFDK